MEKTSTRVRWWDWISLTLLFIMLETLASRLVATNWTPFLYLTQTATYIAFVIGIALGYSTFSQRVSQWLSFFYLIVMLPLQWTLVIEQKTPLEEQMLSVAGRLFFSTSDFIAGQPVEDPIFFVVVMTFAFWFISSWAGFTLVRNQNHLGAVIPSAVGLLIIQNYDRASAGRLWFIAFFTLMALLLLGRLHFLQNKKHWQTRRVFLSPDNSIELSSSMAIGAALLILISWTLPASLSSWQAAADKWSEFTQPWREFAESMDSAISALESPSGGKRGEFFGPELPLGRGFPLSDTVMFTVQTPDLPSDQRPPRYYWRGRTYDYFVNGQWYTTETERVDYDPTVVNPFNVSLQDKTPAHFVFNTSDSVFSLLYAPSQPIWVSRAGITFTEASQPAREVVAWHAYPALQGGETYQVDAVLATPNQQQLREAGTEYPEWVKEKYLQLPEAFSPRIQQLAQEVTANAETPYDKVAAVTSYLRTNIEYSATIPNPPRNADTLEWVMFDHKQGYCVYYASAEILMLRSLGIPTRMAVGFAQGTGVVNKENDIEDNQTPNEYIVQKKNAHSWPEVYFPNVGWVEFEPTGNMPSIDRPLAPRDPLETNPLNPRDGAVPDDSELAREPEDVPTPVSAMTVKKSLSPLFYMIPLVIAAVALLFFVNHRYPFARYAPALVRVTLERTGFDVPNWVYHWEKWGYLTPIEKAFESINFGLRTLDRAVPVHTTPMERANKLTGILPQISEPVKVLLDEHQTSLYTSRVANVIQARHAAFEVRKQVIAERIRYLFVGRPQPH